MLTIADQVAARSSIVHALTDGTFDRASVLAGCAYLREIVTPAVAGGLFALPAPCSCCECPTCDARIDRWHDGYYQHREGRPCPSETYAAQGWQHRSRNLPWEATDVVERPEGYYHSPLGTFDQ